MSFLYEKIEDLKDFDLFDIEFPQYLKDNISENIILRDYQITAIINTLIYLQSKLSKNKQIHLLYHMATGSGKTVIMALNILYYYTQGYRNFLFFTNQRNIVSKTKINFLDKYSSKYLFAKKISINGNNININEVENFENANDSDINICFDTVQGIHSSLSLIKEGALSIEDFENKKIVLIADEAHHLNSTTAADTEERKTNETWEDTVNRIFYANKDNVLLEFTATCDLKDPNVLQKYYDKIVFNFDLKEFRNAGYTKEFMNMSSNVTPWTRTLQALIMSEYRKLMFEHHNTNIKPVVLLKSKTIKESDKFYNLFYNNLKNLKPSEIENIRISNAENKIFNNAFEFFDSLEFSYDKLVDLIRLDFSEENSVNMNELNDENERIVNNLDEKNNHYRLIFIVDKLTEGWDVLSLFDIVRLYETRQGQHGRNETVSKYTISEAQLIGRGARYCPFKFEEEQNPNKRKYSDYENKLSICETLLYHCMDNSSYISEIKKALKQTGLISEEEPQKINYKLKKDFKHTSLYLDGKVFLNKRKEVSRNSVKSLPEKIRGMLLSYKCSGGSSITQYLFDDSYSASSKEFKELDPIKFKDIRYSILYKAFRLFNSTLSFRKLKLQFPNLKSISEFLLSDNYLGNITITFSTINGIEPTPDEYLGACKNILKQVSDYVQGIEVTYRGTHEFYEKPINEIFTDKVRNITRIVDDLSWGEGISQSDEIVDSRYRMDLSDKDWYAYEDNYGTSEEKKFVKYFSTIVKELEKNFTNIALIRNELQLGIYSFDDGSKFEPDYVLIMNRKESSNKNLYLCMFIEPKGEHLLQKDNWKNTFMLQLKNNSIPVIKFVDDNDYYIWGTPLYNEKVTKTDFETYFKESVNELIVK